MERKPNLEKPFILAQAQAPGDMGLMIGDGFVSVNLYYI